MRLISASLSHTISPASRAIDGSFQTYCFSGTYWGTDLWFRAKFAEKSCVGEVVFYSTKGSGKYRAGTKISIIDSVTGQSNLCGTLQYGDDSPYRYFLVIYSFLYY